jgi:flagellar hook-basal body complex protein FliE
MVMIAIDSSKIEAMVAQMRSAVSNVQSPQYPALNNLEPTQGAVDFAQVFKSQLDQVNGLEKNSQQLSERFSLGDDSVNLSDVMISSQKAGIAMQASIQVRNKLVIAYNDIMNMSV